MTVISEWLAGKLNDIKDDIIGLYFWSNSAAPNKNDTPTAGTDGSKNLLTSITSGFTSTIVGTDLIITYAIPTATAFPHSKVNGGGATTTSIPLDSTTGFTVRDRISIETSPAQKAVITAIGGGALTIVKYPELVGGIAAAPADDIPVKVLCCQVGVKTTDSPGIADIEPDEFYKEAGIASTGTVIVSLVKV
jgi:hypothetical protein